MKSRMRRRRFGKTKPLSIKELTQAFACKELGYIKLVLLFGSRATNEAHLQSDYDFAIIAEPQEAPWGTIAKAWDDIGDILGLAEYDYDVVDLTTAPLGLLQSIAEGFIVLKGEADGFYRLFGSDHQKSQ